MNCKGDTATGSEPSSGDQDSVLTINGEIAVNFSNRIGQVSEYATGMNTVFNMNSDAFWQNNGVIELLQEINAGVLRWPGGHVTSFYHWNDMNGLGWSDQWDPDYDPSNAVDPSEYTDLAEFIEISREVGAEPMVGINMTSGTKYDRLVDGVEEAKALVQHNLDQGYDVTYYYLDNERYLHGWSAEKYAREIIRYVPELREIDPGAKFIANWKFVRNDLKTLLDSAGQHIDMLDNHEYYDWGKASWERWYEEVPMDMSNQFKPQNDTPYNIHYLNTQNKFAQWGHSDIGLAINEWNIGPSEENSHPSPFQYGLMQSELWFQMVKGGVEMASFWPIVWTSPDPVATQGRYLLRGTDFETNPSADVFKLLGKSVNQPIYSSSSDSELLIPFSVKDGSTGRVYIINKSDYKFEAVINSEDLPISGQVTHLAYQKAEDDPTDAEVVEATLAPGGSGNSFEADLPPYSLNMFEFPVGE